jgi:hypothetical protein
MQFSQNPTLKFAWYNIYVNSNYKIEVLKDILSLRQINNLMNYKNGRSEKGLEYKLQNSKPKHTFSLAFSSKIIVKVIQLWQLFLSTLIC